MPELERVIDDSPPAAPASPPPSTVGDVLTDLRQTYQTGTQTATAPAPAVAPAAPATETPPVATPPAEPAPGAEPAPAAPPVPAVPESTAEPDLPAPESRLAPLFSLAGLPDEEALDQAVQHLNDFRAKDHITHRILSNALYEQDPGFYQKCALEDLGIPADKIQPFRDWLARGGDALPDPESFPAFPVPDPVTLEVVLPNGRRLDTSDAMQAELYESAKFRHETHVNDLKRQQEQTRQEQQRTSAEQARIQAENKRVADERVNSYVDARRQQVNQIVEPAIKNLAPEHQLFGQMFQHYVQNHIETHPEIVRIGREAAPHVLQQSGRVAEYAAAQDKIIRTEVRKLTEQFVNDLKRFSRAEAAAIGTAPKIPAGVQPIESTSPLPNTQFQNFSDIQRAARDADRQARAR